MKVSVSSIKTFKGCRRKYQLKYIEGLEPIKKSEALECGSNYHELIEWLYNNGSFDGIEEDYSKAQAMAGAYYKYIYPVLKCKSVEEWHEYEWVSASCTSNKLVGRFDGVAEDGCLVEHKTTGIASIDEYEYNLQWDEQILAYMLLSGARKMYYTICRKPTIRQKKNETDEEFFKRMCEWYDEDTENKIRLTEVYRTDEEVKDFERSLWLITDDMEQATKHKELNYRNTCHCNSWGRQCEYASVCLFYDPQQTYAEFERTERRNENGD